MLHRIISFYIVLYNVTSYYIMLHRILLCYIVLYYVDSTSGIAELHHPFTHHACNSDEYGPIRPGSTHQQSCPTMQWKLASHRYKIWVLNNKTHQQISSFTHFLANSSPAISSNVTTWPVCTISASIFSTNAFSQCSNSGGSGLSFFGSVCLLPDDEAPLLYNSSCDDINMSWQVLIIWTQQYNKHLVMNHTNKNWFNITQTGSYKRDKVKTSSKELFYKEKW